MGLRFTIDDSALFIIHDADEQRPIGTAFAFIKPQWVVTAKHVVLRNGTLRQHLRLSSPRLAPPVQVAVSFTHPDVDLAVLTMVGDSPCKIPLFPAHERFAGTQGLICCGYSPTVSTQNGNPSLFVNNIPRYERDQRARSEADEDLIVFPAPFLEGGHSGGPVFGEGGGVVGVIIEGFTSHGTFHGRATGIHPLLQSLEFRQ